ncbi:hypothetical protein BKA56DRAFT_234572 [Ilyonectria sp. MPI-CAGE-AT-0026]|nr:hypothetical protein BKA56DRAFT_234572 [Ilyonectria sp. MPI-CAGE-AT-0026]
MAQNGKQRRCPTCLLAMERRMEKEDSSNADEEGRPRRSRRPEHQLGDRLCDEKDSESRKAKRRAEAERCVDGGVKFLPFAGESIRCASCLKRHEARLAAKAICSDCGRRGRVGKKRCEVCQKSMCETMCTLVCGRRGFLRRSASSDARLVPRSRWQYAPRGDYPGKQSKPALRSHSGLWQLQVCRVGIEWQLQNGSYRITAIK